MSNPHPLATNPDLAWRQIFGSKSSISKKIELTIPENKPEDCIRCVCMSDTHSKLDSIPASFIPDGDIFIHAGDFSMAGQPEEIAAFNSFLGNLPHCYKIVIAGNHDVSFDSHYYSSNWRFFTNRRQRDVRQYKSMLTNCTDYLQDRSIILEGYKIYGSPWQPRFCDWAFQLSRGKQCLSKWNEIPTDTDILITHGPPLGHGDYSIRRIRAGCVDLLQTVENRVKPLYHIFGHIHEGYGTTTNLITTFINASTCNIQYAPVNKPIVFDLPKRPVDKPQAVS